MIVSFTRGVQRRFASKIQCLEPLGLAPKGWRARWDLNPGFSAPEADALIRARLRAHKSKQK